MASLDFQVQCDTDWGEKVLLVGSLPSLGAWSLAKAFPMTTTKETYPLWSAIGVPLDASDFFEYKYVKVKNSTFFTWEDGPNRRLEGKDIAKCVKRGVKDGIAFSGALSTSAGDSVNSEPSTPDQSPPCEEAEENLEAHEANAALLRCQKEHLSEVANIKADLACMSLQLVKVEGEFSAFKEERASKEADLENKLIHSQQQLAEAEHERVQLNDKHASEVAHLQAELAQAQQQLEQVGREQVRLQQERDSEVAQLESKFAELKTHASSERSAAHAMAEVEVEQLTTELKKVQQELARTRLKMASSDGWKRKILGQLQTYREKRMSSIVDPTQDLDGMSAYSSPRSLATMTADCGLDSQSCAWSSTSSSQNVLNSSMMTSWMAEQLVSMKNDLSWIHNRLESQENICSPRC